MASRIFSLHPKPVQQSVAARGHVLGKVLGDVNPPNDYQSII